MAELIPCDLHVHPDYSIDARSTIKQYCRKAQEINLAVIGFTTHYDINPARADKDAFMVVDGRWVVPDDNAIAKYLADIEAARNEFNGLKILSGLEIDYFPGIEAEVYRLSRKFDFDYFIGSVHCLENFAISESKDAKVYFESHTPEQMADSYFDLLFACVDCGLFEVIGHADYYVRFAPPYFGERTCELFRGRLEMIARTAARNSTGFEINTQPMRRGKHFHPRLDFLKELTSFGATINSIGSDAHDAEDLGKNILDALVELKKNQLPLKPFYVAEET